MGVELTGICKRFGSVVANKGVNLRVRMGEIHSLLGENGSGKTTLMNMLSGIYSPDEGEIKVFGKVVTAATPKEFINMGVGMIHQHFKLVDVLTAKENIILGQKGSFLLNEKKLSKEIEDVMERFGLRVDLDKKIYNMSVSEKQTVEILKVLYRGARILILDEPTAVLTPQEIGKLFDILRNMKKQGCGVILITHKLNEVKEISDRITVLRKGESVATVDNESVSVDELTELIVGRQVDLAINRCQVEQGEKLLVVDNLVVKNELGISAVNGASFSVNRGEILGVAGVAGSGQKELCEALAGLYKIESGKIFFNNENLVGKTPREIIKMGITMSFVPEDRLGMGLVASMNIVDNVILKSYQDGKGMYLNRKPARELSLRLVKELEINTPGIQHPVRNLSGGNVQKVLLGREIQSGPQLLITAYPVRGLDINSSFKIYELLNEQKVKGVGVLFIGEDLDVLLELCDRIMVMCNGKVMGIVNARETKKESIGLMMTGGENGN